MNTQDVLQRLDDQDDDEFEVDDPDDPFMDGSDEEFSDLDEEEDDADDDNVDSNTPPDSPLSMPHHSAPSTPPGSGCLTDDLPRMWTSLKPVTIQPFKSTVGPTVPISDSPLELFQLFFATPLLQKIVDESNRYWYKQ